MLKLVFEVKKMYFEIGAGFEIALGLRGSERA